MKNNPDLCRWLKMGLIIDAKILYSSRNVFEHTVIEKMSVEGFCNLIYFDFIATLCI